MMTLLVGIGILLILIGVIAFFVPAVTKIVNFPGNERVKAAAVLIVGIIFTAAGYIFG